jgi:hypothetical protein
MNTHSIPAIVPGLRGRLKAAGIHLSLSLAAAGTLVLLASKVWYPAPLFALSNGRDIFLLVVACDMVLGPMMTLIVFNTRKPRAELVRDLAIIAIVQLAAMGYGVSTLLIARPAYIVYNAGQFNVPLANELTQPKAKEGAPEPAPVSAPWFGPELMGARLPESTAERNDLVFSSVEGKGDVYQMPHYFVPYDEVRSEVIAHARTPEKVAKDLHQDAGSIAQLIAPYQRDGRKLGLLTLVIRNATALAVIDVANGDFLGIVSPSSEP